MFVIRSKITRKEAGKYGLECGEKSINRNRCKKDMYDT